MLPGFRLIAVSFLCGFVVMFAGLRMVSSLNNVHESLPILAAQAATVQPAGMIEPRGAPSAMPVLYDLRFVGNPATPMLASLAPLAIERASPLIAEAFAAVDSQATPVAPVIIEPLPEPAATEPQFAPIMEPSAPIEAKVAAIAPDPNPAATATAAPQPPEAKRAPRAGKPVRKKRLARRAAPRNEFGDSFGNSSSNNAFRNRSN